MNGLTPPSYTFDEFAKIEFDKRLQQQVKDTKRKKNRAMKFLSGDKVMIINDSTNIDRSASIIGKRGIIIKVFTAHNPRRIMATISIFEGSRNELIDLPVESIALDYE